MHSLGVNLKPPYPMTQSVAFPVGYTSPVSGNSAGSTVTTAQIHNGDLCGTHTHTHAPCTVV